MTEGMGGGRGHIREGVEGGNKNGLDHNLKERDCDQSKVGDACVCSTGGSMGGGGGGGGWEGLEGGVKTSIKKKRGGYRLNWRRKDCGGVKPNSR